MGCLTARFTAVVLVSLLWVAPELTGALTQPSSTQEQQQETPAQQPQQPAIQVVPPASTILPAAPPDAQPIPDPKPDPDSGQQVDPAPQPLPDAPSAAPSGANGQAAPSQQSQNNQQAPAGTAAATIGNPKGGLASRPAGAAIAPSRQRRTRSLLIKMGLVAGAGVALGSVIALSQGSPSRPPGAH